MKTPVIIAAYNEADQIGKTLRSLDTSTTEPFIVVNGDEGHQETVDAALQYTSNVFSLQEQGKLPSIQYGLERVFEHDGHATGEPIAFIDADTETFQKEKWAPTLSKAVAGSVACSAAGVVLLNDGPVIDNTIRNARRLVHARRDQKSYTLQSAFGANFAINFADDQELIDKVLGMQHIWPGEDRYLIHVLAGENQRFTQLANLGSAVLTSARFLPPLSNRFKLSRAERTALSVNHYHGRKAQAVTHYFDDNAGVLVPHSTDN